MRVTQEHALSSPVLCFHVFISQEASWPINDHKLACYGVEAYYRQTSNISGTKYRNLNVSRLALHLSLHSPLKQGVKSGMKM